VEQKKFFDLSVRLQEAASVGLRALAAAHDQANELSHLAVLVTHLRHECEGKDVDPLLFRRIQTAVETLREYWQRERDSILYA
jgi:hypothetical protein